MLTLRCLPILCLCACAGTPAASSEDLPAPEVAVVAPVPAGTRCRVALARGVPDEPLHRAALVWWREALRQSAWLEFATDDDRQVPVLELTIDPAAKALAAAWRDGERERPLAGASHQHGDLPTAIDRLAWSARLALGETCARPVPIGRGTSTTAAVVLAVDDASQLARDGGFQAARRLLREARARDGASPFVLEPLAAVELLHGDFAAAERTAREALGYEARMLPTTRHRLGRTMLLARASANPERATRHDQELLALATAGRRERPHDEEPLLSEAIARNFLGEFPASRPLLQQLAARLPEHAIVAYHLGWAHLGSGDAAAAVPCFERAAARLPAPWLLLPRAIAAFESGQHASLRTMLADLRRDAEADEQPILLDLLRLQAAHALLTGDAAAARTHLLSTLTWLWKHPLALRGRIGEFAEQGALAVRLGAADQLPPLLAAIQQQNPGQEVADICAYIAGLVAVQRQRERQPATETLLAHGGDSPWSQLLAAYAHECRGEVADMQQALERAARLASTPMTKALLARGLAAAGRAGDAATLRATLRAEMRTIHLRRTCRHPLLGPELAFAFVDD